MKGEESLWMPGTDHAGIATQNVVERQLQKEGLTRDDVGRKKFVERVWDWKEKYGQTIIEQLKRLGASCDWSRLRFTMDDGCSAAVQEVFVRLYNEGLIYRDYYIINWCPRCQTALSDLEVEYREIKGQFYYIKYPLKNGGSVTVATTRPETMLGDTAVAVNPGDERYKSLVGQEVILPILKREIQIIAEDAVDPEFGTGAVKVTPAHDPVDFMIGKKHKLREINVMNPDATMNANAGKYKGKDRFQCRKELVIDLGKAGFLEKTADHLHSVGHCYRCQAPVEPYLSKQWFVRMKSLAEPAIEAVKKGRVKFVPSSWESTYFEWMNNIKDWCISRQIWWGHRLPVWYCECGEIQVSKTKPEKCKKCGSEKIKQDDDVLDTWFSSALWPFSTLGWPKETEELKTFYPTSILSTAFDIIYFWVARMIVMGLKFMNDVPFRQVYFHALVRDAERQKMSKSSGNVIDPLVVIDQYGADALRFTLAAFAAQGRDICLSEERIEGYRNFTNKIWNAARFVSINLADFDASKVKLDKLQLTLADRWILSRLNKTIDEMNRAFTNCRFNDAAAAIYEFFWHEFCDWYIELAKSRLVHAQTPGESSGKNGNSSQFAKLPHTPRESAQAILYHVLDSSLRLLHPFMPFITEEIWHSVISRGESLAIAEWPKYYKGEVDGDVEEKTGIIIETIRTINRLRSESGILPKAKITVLIKTAGEKLRQILREYSDYIISLANVEKLQIADDISRPSGSVAAVISNKIEVYIPLKGLVDLDAELKRIKKEIANLEAWIERAEERLADESFLAKAPVEVIGNVKKQKQECVEKKERLEANLRDISG